MKFLLISLIPKTVPGLKNIHPGLMFKKKSEWEMANKEVNEGLAMLETTINHPQVKESACGADPSCHSFPSTG